MQELPRRPRMLEEAEEKARKLIGRVAHIPDDEVARAIREDREGR